MLQFCFWLNHFCLFQLRFFSHRYFLALVESYKKLGLYVSDSDYVFFGVVVNRRNQNWVYSRKLVRRRFKSHVSGERGSSSSDGPCLETKGKQGTIL